jgi:hypothetical protein
VVLDSAARLVTDLRDQARDLQDVHLEIGGATAGFVDFSAEMTSRLRYIVHSY